MNIYDCVNGVHKISLQCYDNLVNQINERIKK